MSTVYDREAWRRWWPEWRSPAARVGVLSPGTHELAFAKELYPGSVVESIDQRQWDLSEPTMTRFDLLIACNVWHYSMYPELWFRNVFPSCRELWIQDLLSRRRGHRAELANDGDSMRFALRGLRLALVPTWDLSIIEDRILDLQVYSAGGPWLVSFTARLKGDL